jgi:hypothetical protein
MPNERVMAAVVVIFLLLIMVPWRHTVGVMENEGPPAQGVIEAPTEVVDSAASSDVAIAEATIAPDVEDQASDAPPAEGSAGEVEVAIGDEAAQSAGDAEALLPSHRILSYYGFPGDPMMGILGEYEMEELLARLRDQAEAYEAVDPDRPLKLAFEVIATVAQRDPGMDGNYLAGISNETIQEYVDFTGANDMLLILDMQFGRNTVQQEIDSIRQWLEYPHVHLALDPEFAIQEGEVPGENLGRIDATDVTYAQNELAAISREFNIPPKILVVHQFTLSSITNRETIQPVPGVQFLLEVDGWGPPHTKEATYDIIVGPELIEFYGFKLWYKQDEPLMTPEEVLNLDPSPDLVIYQ